MATQTIGVSQEKLDDLIITGLGNGSFDNVAGLLSEVNSVLNKANCLATKIEINESIERLRKSGKITLDYFFNQTDTNALGAKFKADYNKHAKEREAKK